MNANLHISVPIAAEYRYGSKMHRGGGGQECTVYISGGNGANLHPYFMLSVTVTNSFDMPTWVPR